ncbi:MAG: S1 family peptidase, partial [Armatimonadota bacterium]
MDTRTAGRTVAAARRPRPWRTGAVIAALIAMQLGPAAPPGRGQVALSVIENAIQRSVQVGLLFKAPDGGARLYSTCSGAFIAPLGLVLTNSHCVRADKDIPDLKITKGQLYHPDGLALLSVHVPGQAKPAPVLFGRYVVDDTRLDLALVRSERLLGAARDAGLPSDFRVPFLTFGDGENLRHGEPIVIVGFPGVGDDTVTVSRGHVTGFLVDGQGRRMTLKTDVGAPGFSGSPMINERGELVAVHFGSVVDAQSAARSGRATIVNRLPPEWMPHLRTTGVTAISGPAPPSPAPAPSPAAPFPNLGQASPGPAASVPASPGTAASPAVPAVPITLGTPV